MKKGLLISTVIVFTMFFAGCGGPDLMIMVPNLTNMRFQTAEKVAQKRDLKLVIEKYEASEFVPEGSIISQDPSEGAYIKTARSVFVVVSSGKRKMKVPNLIGMRYGDAQDSLLKIGLAIGGIEEESSNASDVGYVVRQFPAPDSEVDRNTPITLTVSVGQLTTVPNVLGLPVDQASETLQQAGFEVNLIAVQKNLAPYADANIVLRTDPEPNRECDTKNKIDIYFRQP